jgi:hypothetical protein
LTLLAMTLGHVCMAITLENVSPEPWNAYDFDRMNYSVRRCGELYPDAPCLRLWRKYEHQQYTAICGAERGAKLK